jgi:cell wall-associated NlpC family hydrolase
MNRRHIAAFFSFLLIFSMANAGGKSHSSTLTTTTTTTSNTTTTVPSNSYSYKSFSNPSRTEIYDATGVWVATMTLNSYTVTLAGPQRTFSEQTPEDPILRTVTHSTWVRVLPKPFTGTVDTAWLDQALKLNQSGSPDILAIALQYISAAPAKYNGSIQIAGDANYGPLLSDGTRQEGSDFHDYLGLNWSFPDLNMSADPNQFLSLDCSGFMRMVFGYRSGVPLSYNIISGNSYMPRKSFQIYSGAPGTILISNTGTQPTDISMLRPGDLLFWDASTNDGTQLDHVGMYLGIDSSGHARFISSRKSINGPTMGDYKGASVIDSTGLYSTTFRAARRM